MLAVTFGASEQINLSNDAGRKMAAFINANGPNMAVAVSNDAGMTVDSLPAVIAPPAAPVAVKSNTVMFAVIGGAGLLAGLLLGRLTK